jgi:phosphoserine phosphatase
MHTAPSQDQLNRIESDLRQVKELLELLVGKIAVKEKGEVEEVPNEYFRKALQEAREARKQGKASPIFDTAEEMIAWLHKQGA